ncbi:MAG: prephenate/arogenate dehydrogenase [Oculatellaceae cyanobacterium bins.114]|nr:prephenate/arogenate dehydrogenase [Oculatellaceae cyanobacterium bins.114]
MKVGIVGLGLIGGSIALDLRQLRGYTILGVSRRPATCQQAIARGVVDDASPDLAILSAADVIFLCTPLDAIKPTVEQLLPHLAPTTVLTDVGSVKQPIVEAIAPLWHNFVGGHPMAGTADSGLDAAQKELFVNRAYVLTPIDTTPPDAVEVVATIARSLQAQVYQCAPLAHDQAVAWISHLPVMVSSSLIAACLQETNSTVLELAQTFASSGFRDTSRVGGGNPELGLMMAKYNQTALLRSLQTYRDQLDQTISLIEQANWEALEAQLEQTHDSRPTFVD